MALFTCSKNSYAAVTATPLIAPAVPMSEPLLSSHLSALLPTSLLRELASVPVPMPVDTPGDVNITFLREKDVLLSVAAHKFLLHARCAPLRQQLAKDDTVTLNVDSDVTRGSLLALMYYIYTGRTACLTDSGGPSKSLRYTFMCLQCPVVSG